MRLRRDKGITAEEVGIPVDTDPGEVAQVDFGSIGKRWDPMRSCISMHLRVSDSRKAS